MFKKTREREADRQRDRGTEREREREATGMRLSNVHEGGTSSIVRKAATPSRILSRAVTPSRTTTTTTATSDHVHSPSAANVNGLHTRGENRSAPVGSVSVTVLTLDGRTFPLTHPGDQQSSQARTADRDGDDGEVKLVKDFHVRRKYGRRFGLSDKSQENKTFLEFGLLGTKYFNCSDSNGQVGTSNTPLPEVGAGKKDSNTSLFQPGQKRSQLSKTDPSDVLQESKFKALSSFVSTSLPGLSFSLPNKSTKSKDLFPTGCISGSSSLLASDFGLNAVRTDMFSGHKRFQGTVLEGLGPENGAGEVQLLKALERQATRQIFACQNTGYFRRGSRAAQSVLNFRQTVFSSQVEPSISRFLLPDGRGGGRARLGTPLVSETGPEEQRKRLAHPAPGARLSTPKIPDRQEEASRRAALPSISGSSVSVMLTHSHSK